MLLILLFFNFRTNVQEPQNLLFLLLYRNNGSSILDFKSGIDYLLRAHSIDTIVHGGSVCKLF